MALFVCLRELAEEHGFFLTALHVNHGIRGEEAERDQRFVENLTMRWQVPLIVRKADVPAYAKHEKIGLELAARQMRQQFFAELHAAGTVDAVATAHHMEDNAESLLLHMARGSGLEGLAGIQPQAGFFIRPFLGLHRGQIREYLRQRGQQWVEDSTNEDVNYSRNYVRHELLPRFGRMNPQAVEALNRLAAAAGSSLDFLKQAAARVVGAVQFQEGEAQIDLAALTEVHEAVASQALRLILAQLGRMQDVQQAHIEALLRLCRSGRTGALLHLGSGWQAQLSYGRLRLWREAAVQPEPFEQKLNLYGVTELPVGRMTAAPAGKRGAGSGWSEYLDEDRIPLNAVLRTRRPGDTFRPLHGMGSKKLKDYFMDLKLPRPERDCVPLLAEGPRILWVIGHRLSQDVAVGEQTKRIVHLTYERTT